ncbi:MAG: thiamine phosphate synthase [Bacteroidia bacterium]
MKISSLQYITQEHDKYSHSDLCKMACDAGLKWVQLRMKNVSDKEFLKEANVCREITSNYNSTLIINDNIKVAIDSQADGVHLGLTDLSTKEARNILGNNKIIGGTANTFEDILMHSKNGVNYVGVGPYRFTKTKDKLSPILGIDGYQKIIAELKKRDIEIPVIAIGGILFEDIKLLKEVGLNGIAVSGLLTNNFDKTIINNIKNTFSTNYANA